MTLTFVLILLGKKKVLGNIKWLCIESKIGVHTCIRIDTHFADIHRGSNISAHYISFLWNEFTVMI